MSKGRMNMTHSTYSVTATSGTALSANGQRNFLILQNIGANEVWVRLDGATATADTDLYLAAGGNGILVMDYTVPTAAITAVCSTAETSTLSIVEGQAEH